MTEAAQTVVNQELEMSESSYEKPNHQFVNPKIGKVIFLQEVVGKTTDLRNNEANACPII